MGSSAWPLAALMRPGCRTRAELKMACLRRIAAADLTGNQSFLLVNFVETYSRPTWLIWASTPVL